MTDLDDLPTFLRVGPRPVVLLEPLEPPSLVPMPRLPSEGEPLEAVRFRYFTGGVLVGVLVTLVVIL